MKKQSPVTYPSYQADSPQVCGVGKIGWLHNLATKAGLDSYLPRPSHGLGLTVVLIASLFCLWFSDYLIDLSNGKLLGLSSLTLAILLGMLLGNTVYPRFAAPLSSGVDFAKSQCLRLAIVLYGFKVTLTQVASVGSAAIAIDALVLTSTFLLTYILGHKWLKLDKQTTLLIGAGSSICGAAAVIATEPVVKAEAYKVTIAVATVVVFGTLAMLLYPLLYQLQWLAATLGAEQYGVYIGSTVHEVAQVVVAGNAISTEVGNTAVVTKMIRVMMLAPFLLILSFVLSGIHNNVNPNDSLALKPTKTNFWQRAKQVHIPWFAFMFLVMIGINSLLHHTQSASSAHFVELMVSLDNLLLTMAMFALGLTTHFSAIKKAGFKPLLLAALVFGWLLSGGAAINMGIQTLVVG
ncbi:YeiH family putative sulfate export transporter [Psychrobacter sp. FDAARGOS_221]|nr:YeiH family putative sulfate export transporter [Psychrobacter sp. FDAARGOS_221]